MIDNLKLRPYTHSLFYECRRAQQYRESRNGMFKVGDVVCWQVKNNKYRGCVVEVVPYHKYPRMWPGLRVRGYYRETESYVVFTSDGKYMWPRVGLLGSVSS